MFRTRIIAKLEIKSEYVVKPIFFEGLKKIGDPIKIAKKYYNDGIDEMIIIDIVSSLYRRPINFKQLKEISKNIFIPITYGGGIKNLKDIENCLKNGADKVSINTHSINSNGKLIERASKEFGSQCIISNIEAKKIENEWFCYTDGGRINSGIRIQDWIKNIQEKNVGEIFVQSIDHDGFTDGPDYKLIEYLKNKIKVPFIIGSGFRSYEHLKRVKKIINSDAVCFSSALHHKDLNIKKIKKII